MIGLSEKEAKKRLLEYGENRLKEGRKKSVLQVFLGQFKDLLVIILLFAAALSVFTGNVDSSIVIICVLILNAVLGTIQFVKARESLDALKAMSAPKARVVRDGKKTEVDSFQVVPGDLLLLEAGDIIAADGCIVKNHSLKVNESALTGESVSVDKDEEENAFVYQGSIVTYGRAEVNVTATGMQTEIGRIATLLKESDETKTPLEVSMEEFSKRLAVLICAVCILVFGLGIYRKLSVVDALIFAVALAVAAIPEALSSIVTIVQALGTKKMAKENAIIKELKAVESLGCVSVICSDKTGTLTQNRMTVQEAYIGGKIFKPKTLRTEDPVHRLLLLNGILNNDSVLQDTTPGKTMGIGDPTEYCLLLMAREAGIDEREVRKKYERIGEIPFDSERKMMSAEYEVEGERLLFTKGALDELLARCRFWQEGERAVPLSDADRFSIASQNEQFTMAGLRVLAFAYKEMNQEKMEEENLIYLGMVSIMDPPRKESEQAVQKAASAGIRTVMITGDYKTTAAAIAKKIGILRKDEEVLSGSELEEMTDAQLDERIKKVSVYARVSPEHKIRIVRAWQRKNRVVAMTGDGVNDAPALKQANIGISMGITGTEVAKDAAGIILADDNFATIVKAVENGRNVYENIKNAILFLLSGNLAGIIVVLFTSIAGLPLPFTAVQLLFINLATDSLPAIAIGMEPAGEELLNQKPRDPKESLLNHSFLRKMGAMGALLAAATLASFYIGLKTDAQTAGTMAFATLTAARLFHGFNCRGTRSMYRHGRLINPFIPAACVAGLLMVMAVLFLSPMQEVFEVVPVSLGKVGILLGMALLPTVVIQLFCRFIKNN